VLIGNGTGCPGDPGAARAMMETIRARDPQADRQLAMLERMAADEGGGAGALETISDDPDIRVARQALTHEECAYLIAMATPQLAPSFVIDPASGRRVPHPTRTSSGMNFGPTLEDLVVHRLNRRIGRLSGTEVEWGEPLHVLRYAPGEEYRPHFDALPGVANQRLCTVLVYLNEDYAGGETRFDALNITFRGSTGDALIFRNLDGDGRAHPKTRHAGLPVTGGVKWLATRWIRQRPYDPLDA
jgi:prolyl 4-hydroxylase